MNDMFEKASAIVFICFLICASLAMISIVGMAIYMIATGNMQP